MFTSSHFIWLGIIGILIATALIALKKLKISDQTVGKAVMILLIILKIFHLSLSMKESEFGGYIIDQTQLSFHLCSIMIYSVIFSNIIKNKKVVLMSYLLFLYLYNPHNQVNQLLEHLLYAVGCFCHFFVAEFYG